MVHPKGKPDLRKTAAEIRKSNIIDGGEIKTSTKQQYVGNKEHLKVDNNVKGSWQESVMNKMIEIVHLIKAYLWENKRYLAQLQIRHTEEK